jgi:hypothetical protein
MSGNRDDDEFVTIDMDDQQQRDEKPDASEPRYRIEATRSGAEPAAADDRCQAEGAARTALGSPDDAKVESYAGK